MVSRSAGRITSRHYAPFINCSCCTAVGFMGTFEQRRDRRISAGGNKQWTDDHVRSPLHETSADPHSASLPLPPLSLSLSLPPSLSVSPSLYLSPLPPSPSLSLSLSLHRSLARPESSRDVCSLAVSFRVLSSSEATRETAIIGHSFQTPDIG